MFNLWINMSLLALEAQRVIWLRAIKLAMGGPAAGAEAGRMVTEKITAASKAADTLMTGGSPNAVVLNYRKKVRSNAKRLSK